MELTDPLLTAREGAKVLQVSIPTFWRRVADGTVPKPVKIGALSRWPRSEIVAVIEQAKAARSQPARVLR
ncbi:DNA-binding protein [Sinorhizobium medicae]|uniref:helix-turn-helix transcriptional regulator n=1 Tax=Sinorhizobium medicae TaxID=110321 RepID=UPI001AAF1172|nr:DNA-binding protein [Sinorhizobium medicae]MBO1963838.1 DNA-binding protein [Sinorhizobium medicae]